MRMKRIHLLMVTFFIFVSLVVVFHDESSYLHSYSDAYSTDLDHSPLIDDIFISVKTSQKFHSTRIDLILRTWYTLAPKAIYFFTDSNASSFYKQSPSASSVDPSHIINTNCSSSHNRQSLCCKMDVELQYFLKTSRKWFCHVDDDNYLNVPRLVDLLSSYSPNDDWYLGKPSISVPLQILDRRTKKRVAFWFATGGAGFCLSRSLMLKSMPFISHGRFIQIGSKIRLPDDVTLGYIIDYLMQVPLTVVEQFHSHLEPLKLIKAKALHEQITFSYKLPETNTVDLPDGFDKQTDPTRLLTLHCFLHPKASMCHNLSHV